METKCYILRVFMIKDVKNMNIHHKEAVLLSPEQMYRSERNKRSVNFRIAFRLAGICTMPK